MDNEARLHWLKERQRGIGGSDAPALVLSPEQYKWSRPIDIWKSKVELIVTPDEPSLAAEIGTELEEFIAKKFAKATGLPVRRDKRHFIHPEYPFMVGNIDRKIVGQRWGLECKTTSAFNKNAFTEETFPLHYFVQIQHYLAVTGWEKWYLAAIILNFKFVWYEVPRDDAFIEQVLIPTERDFWKTVEEKNNIWEV